MTGGPGHGVTCLHADDLIDDHEVVTVSDDRLAHEGIADQLTALVTTVKTPSNIALYGPWGSGKSGIANLLKAQVDGKNGVQFARFDAFKYAELPLRRNFVSAIARELGQKSNKYHDDLYNGRTKTDIRVPAATIAKLLGIFALLIAGLTVVLAVVVAIVAWVQNGDFTDSFRSLSKATILAGLAPAALLAGLVALASKTFQVDRSVAKPESDEQFERLFRDLVADSRAKRLVVFVDELDRCSASEVVATLDTVRTFLGIERCVFVVAADQQVLEEALTLAAKQETPADEANPYYSTGSAYLDKVFQYQVSLPPLLSQSVSNYASTLLQGRSGLWAEINAAYVLSVLIPTHVTSPRRVKHLLNTFALTYRLAQERYRSHLLTQDPCANAAAIARLVCLRVEFPLFARHLEVDANLPNLVLALMKDPKTPFAPSVSDRARALAKSYALDEAAPGRILVNDEDSADDPDHEAAQRTGAAHNKQLLNYLSRTRRVKGPSRDLIYLQSSGTVLGLDGDLAHAIESAAEDGDIETLQRRIAGLDEPSQEAVLQLLAQQIRTGAGLAGPNTARSLLLLTDAMPGLPIGHVVDTVAESISVLHDDSEVLDDETIESAWNLAKSGSEAGAASLRTLVVTVATAADWAHASDFLLDDAVLAEAAAPQPMAEYLASRFVDKDGTAGLSRLFRLDDEDLLAVLGNVADAVVDNATEAVSVHAEWESRQKDAAAPATPRAASTAQATEPEAEPYDPQALFNALVSESKARETPVQHQVLRILLRVDAMAARSAALRLLGETEPVADPELASAVLAATARRVVTSFPDWLGAISPAAVQDGHAAQVRGLYEQLWEADVEPLQVEPALRGLSPIREALSVDLRADLTAHVVESVDFWARNSEEASALSKVMARVRAFATTVGLIDAVAVANALVASLRDTLASDVAVVDHDDELFKFVESEGIAALRLTADGMDRKLLTGILSEVGGSPWLGPVDRIGITLELIRASGVDASELPQMPTVEDVAGLILEYGTLAAHAASLWVALIKPKPGDLATVYDRLVSESAVTDEFASAVETAHAGWEEDDHAALVARYLSDTDSPVPSDRDLRVLGWASLNDGDVAELLSARFAAATNNNQRQSVVTLWKRAKVADSGARRQLIEQVVFGLLDLRTGSSPNVSAVELALSTLDDLAAPLPYGVKGALGQRVMHVVSENKSLNDKALRIMPKLGYSTTSGLFGRNKRVDFDS